MRAARRQARRMRSGEEASVAFIGGSGTEGKNFTLLAIGYSEHEPSGL